MDSWDSPAFLKRNRFITNVSDPFDEQANEFPDNERRKRFKFGRGNGQWHFAQRTPSPEARSEVNAYDIESPSRRRGSEDAQSVAVGMETQKSKSPTPPIPSPAATSQQRYIDGNGEEMRHETPEINGASISSTSGGLPEAGKPHDIVSEPHTDTASLYSISSNLSESVLPDSQASFVEDDSDAVTQDKPTLGSSASSRIKASSTEPSASWANIDEGHQSQSNIEDDPPTDGPLSTKPTEPNHQIREASNGAQHTIQESAHDFHFLNDEGSSHHDDLRYSESLNETPFKNQLPIDDSVEIVRQYDEPLASTATQFDIVNIEAPATESAITGATTITAANAQASHHETFDNQRAETPVGHWKADRLSDQDNVAKSVAHGDAFAGYASPNEQLQLVSIKTNLMAADDSEKPMHEPKTAVEIIDLESGDEATEQSDTDRSVSHKNEHPSSVFSDASMSEKERGMIISPSALPESFSAPSDEPQTRGSNASDEEISGEDSHAGSDPDTELAYTPSLEDIPSPEYQPQVSSPSEELGRQHSPGDSQVVEQLGAPIKSEGPFDKGFGVPERDNEVTATTEDHFDLHLPDPGITTDAGPKFSLGPSNQEASAQLPSTVEETAQQTLIKSQLLTPETTQRTNLVSRSSFDSLQSVPGEETLPTPQHTQGNRASLAVPTSSAVNQDIPSQEHTTSQEEQDLQIQREESESQLKREEHSLLKDTSLDEKEREDLGNRLPDAHKTPTLVDRLRAIRRASKQMPSKVGDARVVSPWFAPKRSSPTVPDSEEEGEAERSSEKGHRAIKQNRTGMYQTPEKANSLAGLSVRSPPQKEQETSIASSPGYLPPSQPPPPGFRTTLSYFVPLATLQSHYNLSIDVLAVALSATEVIKAATGPKDFTQTLLITDPSATSSRKPMTTAQIFRSREKCFPLIEEGDVVLLRDFKVQTFQRHFALLSTQTSAWAVFLKDKDVQIRGSPVEFGAEERGFVRGLVRWWNGLDQVAKEKLKDAMYRDEGRKRKTGLDSKTKGDRVSGGSGSTGKRESIEGLGVDLPGSQGKARKVPLKERSPEPDKPIESTEPAKRVLRPRGKTGLPEKSESPTKAIDRRSGTVFTGGLGEPESE